MPPQLKTNKQVRSKVSWNINILNKTFLVFKKKSIFYRLFSLWSAKGFIKTTWQRIEVHLAHGSILLSRLTNYFMEPSLVRTTYFPFFRETCRCRFLFTSRFGKVRSFIFPLQVGLLQHLSTYFSICKLLDTKSTPQAQWVKSLFVGFFKDVNILVLFAYLLLPYSKFGWAENAAVQDRTKMLIGKQICCTTNWFLWKLDNWVFSTICAP